MGEARDDTQEFERRVAERTCELTAANARLHAMAAERARVQVALRHVGKLETVLEHLPVGAGLVAPSSRVIFANPEFRRLPPHPIMPAVDDTPGSDWIAHGGNGAVSRQPGAQPDFLDHSGGGTSLSRRASGIPVRDETGDVVAALLVMVDVDAEKCAAARQRLLIREMDHGAKNMLAVVQVAVWLTRAGDMPSFVRAIKGRLKALARVQTLLADDHWVGADLRSLLRGDLAAFLDGAAAGPQMVLRGPPIGLPARAAQPFSMAVHEPATIAIKHGAPSMPAGWPSTGMRTPPPAACCGCAGARPVGRRCRRRPWSRV
ncbi:sensor histidine kinase [Dankookia sp. GCM10030260]|uniref:sensor histidine kinase n=1 Tax=Dankookia sp. GCM10030260 TaxID=3273390 RepID=UPI00361204EE